MRIDYEDGSAATRQAEERTYTKSIVSRPEAIQVRSANKMTDANRFYKPVSANLFIRQKSTHCGSFPYVPLLEQQPQKVQAGAIRSGYTGTSSHLSLHLGRILTDDFPRIFAQSTGHADLIPGAFGVGQKADTEGVQ